MSELTELLEREADVIADRWWRLTRHMPSRQLKTEHVSRFVQELSTSVRDETRPEWNASSAGEPTRSAGKLVRSVMTEFWWLWRAMLSVCEEHALQPSLREVDVLLQQWLSSAIDSAAQSAELREEERRRETALQIAYLSHEIRNPLHSANLALRQLKGRAELPSNPAADVLELSLQRLRDFVEQELVEARLQEALPPDRQTFALCRFLATLVRDLRGEAAQRDVTLEVSCPEEVTIDMDRRLIASAVSNLIRNAVKFTPPGGHVTVRGSREGAMVLVEVQDECGGLPPGAEERLFADFVQIGSDRSGYGLGLAIARHAAEAHRGRITVQNLPGSGCVFRIALPIANVMAELVHAQH